MNPYVLVTIGAGTYFSEYAHLFVLDLARNRVVEDFEWRNQIYKQSTKGFLGAFPAKDNTLWITTEAEIFHFSVKPLRVLKRYSCSFFNDVHFAFFDNSEEQLIVCNTGMDAIEYFKDDFTHLRSVPLVQTFNYVDRCLKSILYNKPKRRWRDFILRLKNRSTTNDDLFSEDMRYKNLTEDFWLADLYKAFYPGKLYDHSRDSRYILFRPHILHPNFICKIDSQYLVTLKNTGEVVSLTTGEKIITGLRGPHDGLLKQNIFILTEAGNGALTYCSGIETLNNLKSAGLTRIKVCDPREGFLRGVDLVSEHVAVAAVSKRREVSDDKPAYLLTVDLHSQQVTSKIEIDARYGTNPFSVVDVTAQYQ